MKMSKIITIVFVLFFNNCFCQDLSLKMEFDKRNYLYGEPINVIASLSNISDKPVYIISIDVYSGSAIDIFLFDQSGNRMKPTYNHQTAYPCIGRIELLPGETVTADLQVGEWYGNDKKRFQISNLSYCHLLPGKYSLKVIYDNKPGNEITANSRIESGIEEFSVSEATEKKDIDALEEIKNIVKNNPMPIKDDDTKKYTELVVNYINNNINSVYSLLAVEDLLLTACFVEDLELTKRIEKTLIKVLDRYPDTNLSIGILYYFRGYRPGLLDSEELKNERYAKAFRKYENFIKIGSIVDRELDKSKK